MIEIALVADLHGNLPAVQALDADLQARGIRKIWCLGDVVGKGPCSADTYDWAMENCEIILMGNWDEGIGAKRFPKDEFYYQQLGKRRMEGLLSFSMEHVCMISGRKMRLFHGRPIMPGPYHVHTDKEILLPYFTPDYDVLGYADVHRQGMRMLDGSRLLFNTGSVGNGLGSPMVQYAVLRGELDSTQYAPLDISMVTVPYDRQKALRDTEKAEKAGLVNADAFRREILTGVYSR
ncbi:MAG: metallophosphoesterase family protein [Clostridiales bacterium]|nr:metallophosphoesterase family protein [Clostridiales bacterium]